jgi:hypothetical protein
VFGPAACAVGLDACRLLVPCSFTVTADRQLRDARVVGWLAPCCDHTAHTLLAAAIVQLCTSAGCESLHAAAAPLYQHVVGVLHTSMLSVFGPAASAVGLDVAACWSLAVSCSLPTGS